MKKSISLVDYAKSHIKRIECRLLGGCIFKEPLEYKTENGVFKVSYICKRCGKKHSYEMPAQYLLRYADALGEKGSD